MVELMNSEWGKDLEGRQRELIYKTQSQYLLKALNERRKLIKVVRVTN
jgi:hypothetical protein